LESDFLLNLIGNTPVVQTENIYLKLEYFNPTGSHKDRTAKRMIEEAMENGLRRGNTVVEYTSGNTGISVAFVSRILGLKSIILVPEGTSPEKIRLIKLYGGEIHFVPANMDGHELAENIAKENNGIFLAQTRNMANFRAHYENTGPEIKKEIGEVDAFVMGAGTGGTVYGVGKYLKDNGNTEITLILPHGSFAQEKLTGERNKDREIMEGFTYHGFSELIERVIDEEIADHIEFVSAENAIRGMRALWTNGIPGGPTSGANYFTALKLAKKHKKCATIVADRISRYPSLFGELI
jgi:cysteine synthase A